MAAEPEEKRARPRPARPTRPPEGDPWFAPGNAASEGGLPRYLGILRAGWWMIVLALVLSLVGVGLYLSRAEKVYEAETDVLVTPIPRDATVLAGLGLVTQSSDPTRDVETIARLVETNDVAREARTRLRSDRSVGALLADIAAEPVAQSNIVTITARAPTAEGAKDFANLWGDAFVAVQTDRLLSQLGPLISRLETQLQGSTPEQANSGSEPLSQTVAELKRIRAEGTDPTVRVINRAETPTSAVSPKPKLSLAAAILVGLVLGIGGAFGTQLLDTRLRREEQLRQRYRIPILARIPLEHPKFTERFRRRRTPPLAPDELSLPGLDSYRMLGASLSTARLDGAGMRGRTVLVTGPSPGDGKTTSAINLAASLAGAGKRVILIEGDSRRPSISRALGIEAEHGVTSVATGRALLEDALVPADELAPKLQLLLRQPSEAQMSELLSRLSVDTLLLQAERLSDWVVFDSPPLNHVPDTLPMAKRVDDVVLVVRLGNTRLGELDELAELLAQQGIVPAGFVVVGGVQRSGYY